MAFLGIHATAAAPQKPLTFGDIKPIFDAHCTRCHSAEQHAGGLSLASRADVLKSGVVVPRAAVKSRLMARLTGTANGAQMPLGFAPLDARDISTIRDWIDTGCKDGARSRPHWAYIAPVRPPVPSVKRRNWPKNPIDAFVLSRLEREGISPSPEADRPTLIRRITLDLIGLPPTPQEVDAFVSDRSPNAYEKVVDRLLASPHYGEKMALPWLDAARYADSNGFQQDGDTFQYVWRDWVVKALNDNMPFDQFTIEQLAGDLLPGATLATPEGRTHFIATGFNRDHMLNGEGGAIPEEQRNVALFDRVDTTATTWLGVTMACARCHDHKYDPFTQRDYYSLLAFFNKVPESGIVGGSGQYRIADPWVYAGSPEEMSRLYAMEAQVGAAKSKADPAEKDHLKQLQAELDKMKDSIPRVMVMSDAQPRETHVFSRGNYTTPLTQVTPCSPASLPPMPDGFPRNRLGLAKWIVSPQNPLTARVQVNRYWQSFFGYGLVRTPEDFGVKGELPTFPELLDWLATEFEGNGWNVKKLVRLIVTSATYRQSSKVSPAMAKRDPDNRLLARGARFRLPSMILRDEALATSGLLNPAMGGKPVYPYQPAGIWDGLAITDERDFTYPQSKGQDLYRPSIYTFWRRTAAPGDMFDSASRQVCTVRASHTSPPLNALTMLNDVLWVEAGRALGERCLHECKGSGAALSDAFKRVCAREPDTLELKLLNRALARATNAFQADPKQASLYLSQGASVPDKTIDPVQDAAYATVCSAILNLDEAQTKE